jgi:hypothetical protein
MTPANRQQGRGDRFVGGEVVATVCRLEQSRQRGVVQAGQNRSTQLEGNVVGSLFFQAILFFRTLWRVILEGATLDSLTSTNKGQA